MFPGQHRAIELIPPLLKKPVEMSFTFVGGPFDGHKNTATVFRELNDKLVVTMTKRKKNYLYRYAGDNTFKYEKDV